MRAVLFALMTAITSTVSCAADAVDLPTGPWVPDQGDGTYKNPVLFADYSDPDVIRVGDDFYLTHSSFDYAPGLLIWHSRDLINWRPAAAAQGPIGRIAGAAPCAAPVVGKQFFRPDSRSA